MSLNTMITERRRKVQNQAPGQRTIEFSPQIPAEDRARELARQVDLARIHPDYRPANSGHEEEEADRRGTTSGF